MKKKLWLILLLLAPGLCFATEDKSKNPCSVLQFYIANCTPRSIISEVGNSCKKGALSVIQTVAFPNNFLAFSLAPKEATNADIECQFNVALVYQDQITDIYTVAVTASVKNNVCRLDSSQIIQNQTENKADVYAKKVVGKLTKHLFGVCEGSLAKCKCPVI